MSEINEGYSKIQKHEYLMFFVDVIVGLSFFIWPKEMGSLLDHFENKVSMDKELKIHIKIIITRYILKKTALFLAKQKLIEEDAMTV